jgi:serine/threonine protein kinase
MTPAAKPQTPEEGFVDELKPGTTLLHGQYTIRKYLNAGGFGITYLAADSLDRSVVIKECFPGAFCRRSNLVVHARSRAFQNELGTIVQLFLKEARSLSKLSHPNIVGVHQVFEGNNTAYMALDFIQGEDLFNLIERRDPRLTPATIRAILEKLLDAIGAVHGAGLLHRDISPDNIIITDTLEPMLIDFGAAREQATRKTRALSALRIVKDGYSPQEFYIAGSEQGPASDLYSLAATFYHVITGQVPPNSQMRIAAQVEGKPDPYVPLGKQTNAFDPAFCAALDRAIGILPKARFQSAHEWLAAAKSHSAETTPKHPSSSIVAPPSAMNRLKSRKLARAARSDATVSSKRPSTGLKAVKLLAGGTTALALALTGIAVVGSYRPTDGSTEVAVTAAEPIARDTAPASADTTKADAAEVLRTAMAEAPAEAPAAKPATSVAVPTFSPAPVIDAREDIPGVGILTRSWTVDLPFTTTAADDLTITSANGPAAAVLLPGQRIVEVDGKPVATMTEAMAVIQAAKSEGTSHSISVTLTLRSEDKDQPVKHDITIPVTRYADLPSGLAFQAQFADGAWITSITNASTSQGSSVRVGDVLVALMPSREPIADLETLGALLRREAAVGKAAVSVVVRRDGLIWVEDMTIGASAG